MTRYDDPVITVDEEALTIKSYGRPGSARVIRLSEIRSVESIDLGFWTGRARLVGFGPVRPLHFFHWDPKRGSKRVGLVLDLGRRIKTVITPEDPEQVMELLAEP